MADMKKVIKGITHHKLGRCDMSGKICPYWGKSADCVGTLLGDNLSLLKEQEQAMKEKDGTISNLISQMKEISQCYERVVRCKDCNHSEEWYGDKRRCFLWHESGIDVFEDGFCNYGKRK
jgi:hypothetical protein